LTSQVSKRRAPGAIRYSRDVEEAGAARAAQVLAAAAHQQVAVEVLDVHRQLAHRLAGVHQEQGVGPAHRLAHLRDRVHQAVVHGHVGHGHQLDPLVQALFQRGRVDQAVTVDRQELQADAGAFGEVEQRDVVAAVLDG
jgi:hypothetical protein